MCYYCADIYFLLEYTVFSKFALYIFLNDSISCLVLLAASSISSLILIKHLQICLKFGFHIRINKKNLIYFCLFSSLICLFESFPNHLYRFVMKAMHHHIRILSLSCFVCLGLFWKFPISSFQFEYSNHCALVSFPLILHPFVLFFIILYHIFIRIIQVLSQFRANIRYLILKRSLCSRILEYWNSKFLITLYKFIFSFNKYLFFIWQYEVYDQFYDAQNDQIKLKLLNKLFNNLFISLSGVNIA
ncbi:hypothetical protein BpHYR1_039457 [Brachionus plicatilis]|uniref:Uncharacterized protein n=1 Tax=Brachionus plicatilis TaxID=10195 RepID=A0A3M7P9R8_BRAPC|nr:hypothetical protein BpHYR1_039457 [Brachionus plicatilis]